MTATRPADQVRWNDLWRGYLTNVALKTNQRVVDVLVKSLNQKLTGKTILEVGAGSGSDLVALAQMGAICTALDFSPNALQVCRRLARKFGQKLKTVKADCRHLPFASNSFDVVFSVGLVEHFNKPQAILAEQIRVVKPGGLLLIDVPQKYNPYTCVKHWQMRRGVFSVGLGNGIFRLDT